MQTVLLVIGSIFVFVGLAYTVYRMREDQDPSHFFNALIAIGIAFVVYALTG